MQEIVYVFGFNWSSTCGVCLKRLRVCCKYLQPACFICVYVCVCVSSPVGSFNNWKLHTHIHEKPGSSLWSLSRHTHARSFCRTLSRTSLGILWFTLLLCALALQNIFCSWIYGTFIGLRLCHVHNSYHYITACQTEHCSVCSTRVVYHFKTLVRPPSGKLHLITCRSDERIEF